MMTDYKLYDKQIDFLGKSVIMKVNLASIAIIGLNKGLATEVAKNLVLCGIKHLCLCDLIDVITEVDLATGYYYSVDDIGQSRGKTLSNKIYELDQSVEITFQEYDKADIIICINQSSEQNIIYNDYCRDNNKKFINLYSSNNSSILFVDVGMNHIVTNITGETYESVQLLSINNIGRVVTDGHNFKSGDSIMLSNLQGINVEKLNKEFIIGLVDKYTFTIYNYSFDDSIVFTNGTANYVDKPINISHNRYSDELLKPTMNSTSDYNLITDYVHSDIEIISVNSIIASIAAFEVIKIITNKYQPITQWFTWHEPDLEFDSHINILDNNKVLVIGSSLLGCEILKNLAFSSIKKITVIDSKKTKKHNLKNQNSTIEIEYLVEKICDSNIISSNKIFKSKNFDIIFNTVNNADTKKFIASKCFTNNIPLIESSIKGLKGYIQPIIPFITEVFMDMHTDEKKKSFAVCTIKNFPNSIYHTVTWAFEQFEFFNRGPSNINIWLKDKKLKFNNDIKGFQMNKDIWLFTTKYNVLNWKQCAIWAIDMFYDNYYYQILQLLNNFSSELLTKDGTLFWSAGKRCPVPIKLDINNKLHLKFITSTIALLCSCIDIVPIYSIEELYIIINEKKNNIELNSENNAEPKESNKIELFEINEENNITNGISQIFNKNNNYHVEWINITANLRACNYSIELADLHSTEYIPNISIPAFSIVTTMIAGLMTIEMIKYLSVKKLNKFKSTSIDLALNKFANIDSLPARIIEIAEQKFSSWYKFIETDDLSISTFLVKYNKLFNTTINMISLGSQLIHADFIDNDITNKLSNIIKNTGHYILTISSEDDDIELPDIEICL
jgi:ubiquitin-activating enzyme E1